MEYWSWVLALVGMSGVYLTTQKKIAGFMVGMAVQILWIIYAVSTMQYGFIFSALGFGAVNTIGLVKWKRDSHELRNDSSTRDP